jgi:hypothetical protein
MEGRTIYGVVGVILVKSFSKSVAELDHDGCKGRESYKTHFHPFRLKTSRFARG